MLVEDGSAWLIMVKMRTWLIALNHVKLGFQEWNFSKTSSCFGGTPYSQTRNQSWIDMNPLSLILRCWLIVSIRGKDSRMILLESRSHAVQDVGPITTLNQSLDMSQLLDTSPTSNSVIWTGWWFPALWKVLVNHLSQLRPSSQHAHHILWCTTESAWSLCSG